MFQAFLWNSVYASPFPRDFDHVGLIAAVPFVGG